MTESSRIEKTKSQAWGGGALVTSFLTLFLLVLGALAIQPRLSERRQVLHDRFVLTADEVAALPQGTLSVVLDRRPGQDQHDFRYRLLKLVLERSGKPFVLGFSAAVQPQDEAIAALAEGQTAVRRNPLRLSVGVYGAGPDLNRRLRAVPIPVMGGMFGLRAGWTNQASLAELETIRNLQDLQRIVLVQGLGWSDVEIFDRAGLRTYTARSEKLLRLVNDNRVQLFPRAVTELEAEDSVIRSTYPQMLLDPHLLIVYPFAGFFYVAPENTVLADAIESGFERVIADGSYQRLVEQSIMTPWLRRQLKLRSRSILVLQNPEAAEVLADVNPEHWIVPWNDLLRGRITNGNDLCSSSGLKALCSE